MADFFSSMDSVERFYWYLALISSLIFIIQTAMTFLGADTDTGLDADFDGNLDVGDYPFQLFSLRNLVNFLLGLGWGGASLYPVFDNKVVVAIIAVLIGLAFIGIFFFIMRTMMKLAEDNTFTLESTIGKSGDVYLTIPASRKGKGKIFISVKGSTRELDAITDCELEIKQGALVKVLGLEGDMLIVEPLSKS